LKYRFVCEMNDDDYIEFNKYHVFKHPEGKKRYILNMLYLPILLAAVLVFYVLRGKESLFLLVNFVLFAVVSAVWALSYKPLIMRAFKKSVKKMKENGNLPFTASAVMEFYDEFLTEITENTRTEFKYAAVYKVCDNVPFGIYIYQNAVEAFIVPNSAFKDSEERKEFIEFIIEKTNK